MQAATDSAIPKDSWWEKLTNSDAWKVLVTVATVVVVVAAVAGLFLSGPAGWIAAGIAFGAGALLTADDVAEFAKGNMSLGEFVVSMGLNFIPGGAFAKGGKALAKGLSRAAHGVGRAGGAAVAGVSRAASRAGEALAGASRRAVDGVISGVRNDPIYQGVLAAGRRGIDQATGVFEHAGQGLRARTGMLSRVSGDLVLGVRETAMRAGASQGVKGFVTQAAFGAAGNVGVYSVTNAADGKPWTVSGAAAAAAGGAAAGGLGSQAGKAGALFHGDTAQAGAGVVASAGAEVIGGVVEDQLNGPENDYDLVDGLLDAVDGGLLSKFPDAAAISGANPSWGAHVGAAFAGEHAGLGVDAAKFTAKHVVENLTGANAAAPEPNQGTTDSSHGATQ
ncbi:hypothetical protein [Pseudoclavibacter sp. CFCC 13611]|uniref:hypothetical protein n=1 Tax=Pseudoclavibacter sp. CFCC 13611 TaxID=2615178 RepID=UPI001301795C|nr:hypothetical protein [Pseudoclavibacter sp. CFCC 13611]KAB1663630.1 hypothetical protein F8O08_07865 [Pseudoclavibacter sp. CFCC 13611]KAB1664621.1 hypothetical protein F8O08_04415 [Pseudoclavibacter sp. CFCC 13611]